MSVRLAARSAALASALLCSMTGAALAQKNERPPPPPDSIIPQRVLKVFPFDTTWMAVSLNGKAFDREHRPAFTLDKQFRSRGFGGCNTYSATTYAMQDRIAVGPIALTKLSCEKGLNETERAFLVALRTAQAWQLKDGRLYMRGPNGELIFERSL